MPSVPIDNPSLTPMVLKRMPTSPTALTPDLTSAARRSRCMLQVLPSYHMLQMPTCAFCMSDCVRPVPYSMACDAPWLRGCVTRDEYLFTVGGTVRPWRAVAVGPDRETASCREAVPRRLRSGA